MACLLESLKKRKVCNIAATDNPKMRPIHKPVGPCLSVIPSRYPDGNPTTQYAIKFTIIGMVVSFKPRNAPKLLTWRASDIWKTDAKKRSETAICVTTRSDV